jgi:hypothetical protein
VNVTWRMHGVFAAAILGLFLAQYVGFFLLGEGFAFGLGGRAGSPLANAKFSPGLTVGSGRFHLRAGQAVHVRYDATIGAGCLRFYLSRFWPYSLTTFSNTADIQQTSAGQTDLTAPTDGWFQIKIYPSNTAFCSRTLDNHDPWAAASRSGAVSYTLSWKVQPT